MCSRCMVVQFRALSKGTNTFHLMVPDFFHVLSVFFGVGESDIPNQYNSMLLPRQLFTYGLRYIPSALSTLLLQMETVDVSWKKMIL